MRPAPKSKKSGIRNPGPASVPPPVPTPAPPPDPALIPAAEPPATAVPTLRFDTLTPEERSRNMARIRSHDTKPEKTVRRLVTALGLRYRLQRRDLPGKPDLVFGPRRTVLFVHGCFWHQHAGCPGGRIPKGNRDFWETKLNRNVQRDAENKKSLQRLGWRVLTVWECETKSPDKLLKRLARLLTPQPQPPQPLQPNPPPVPAPSAPPPTPPG